MKVLWAFGIAATLCMCGCIPIHTNGTTHYLVIGSGVVSVNNTNKYAASITRENVLGGYASKDGGGIGYKSKQQIMVNTNSDMVIEMQSAPFKPLKVNINK